MIENAIADFAQRMDMPSFSLNENGLAMLHINDTCNFYFEKTEDELLLYLSFLVESYDDTMATKLLEISHYKHNHPYPIFTSLYNNQAILLTRLTHKDVTAAQIENIFQFLNNIITKLR